ncbi:MAG: LegC family aminotransferase [Bacteroidetes bacterium]|nr:LegC family aminotransferase [Bacteroidota bacterium]
MIPLSVPSIKGNEWKYVKECLDTEWVSTAGKYVNLFEETVRDFTKSEFAIACVNGTEAIHISLLLCGVEPGDEVIVPTLTFIAPINAVRYAFAEPVFMDSDDFYNIDIEKTIEFIKTQTSYKNGYTYNNISGKRISAIIPVHVFGSAIMLDELVLLCKERNIAVIEDATESLGTYYLEGKNKNKFTGTIGEMGCFSFNGNKIITTGGGGMIVTNDSQKAEKAKYLTTQAKDDEVRYVHHEVGYNYRLPNVLAAIGVAQMEVLPEYLKIKKKNYNKYKSEIDKIEGLKINCTPSHADNNLWMYAMRIDKNVYGMDREQLMEKLGQQKIQTRPVWFLNHEQKPYKNNYSYKIEHAYKMLEETLNIPCSVNLTDENIDTVIQALKNK